MATGDKVSFTLAEVHEMTGVAITALRRGCRSGQIRHTKIGRARVMNHEQIAEMLKRFEDGGRPVVVSAEAQADDEDLRRAFARIQPGRAA